MARHHPILYLAVAAGLVLASPADAEDWALFEEVDFDETALHLAVAAGHPEEVRALLRGGVEVDTPNQGGQTALHYAAWLGKADLVRALLDAGATADARTQSQTTPLHWAVASSSAEVVRVLLDAGADPNAADRHERTPIHDAPGWEILALLLAGGGRPDLTDHVGWTPLHLARDGRGAGLLLASGASPEATDMWEERPLHHAVQEHTGEVVLALLRAGADPNALDEFGRTPLHHAWRAEVDLDTEAEAEVEWLSENLGRFPMPAEDWSELGSPPVGPAAVRALLAHGARVDVVDGRGRTPLHYQAEHGHTAQVELLLQAGADPGLPDAQAHTPLHLAAAASGDRLGCVRALIAAGAPLEARDAQGQTALLRARSSPHPQADQAVAALLEAGARADVSDAPAPGGTP